MRLHFGLHIELAGKLVPPQLWSLVVALEHEGSLAGAARNCGFSYRHAWEMLRTAERVYGRPLAILERGRGARPSELARRLLAAHQQASKDTAGTLDRIAQATTRSLERTYARVPSALRVCASHDLALIELKHFCAHASPALSIDLQFRGSLEALNELTRGRCEVAGFHIHPGMPDDGQWRRLLEGRRLRLVILAERRQGLMVAASNPKGIRGLIDLTHKGIRFINRQAGSGTRMLVDRLLAHARAKPNAILGYDREEFTHLAVAATIAAGHADAGVGIEAAAAQYGLTFLPLATEAYHLAVRSAQFEREPIRILLHQLSSRALRRRVARLPGYRVERMGEREGVDAVLAQRPVYPGGPVDALPGADGGHLR
jgi:molybdate transport repressor ModE-like protein